MSSLVPGSSQEPFSQPPQDGTVIAADFCPFSQWEKFTHRWVERWEGGSVVAYQAERVHDLTSNRFYLDDSPGTIRLKCLGLALASPFVHIPMGVYLIGLRICQVARDLLQAARLRSCAPTLPPERIQTLRAERLQQAAAGLRLLATPFAIVGLELSALYGLLSPYNGRKLYASFERLIYKGWRSGGELREDEYCLAPCFQPNPTNHLFGGSLTRKNAW